MSLRSRAAVLALAMVAPLAVTAGPAQAAPATPPKPVAAPTSDLLIGLANLLGRLLPAPAPAPALPATAPAVVSQVAASTVKVSGVACGFRLEGSGFSPAPDTIVTNAHVVAGTTRTRVQRPDGRTLPASVVAFDPSRDLAVLHAPGLGQPSLSLASAVPGELAAIFGHPGGQVPVEISPARVLRKVTVDIGDIYDRPAPPRQILILNSDLEPGDSGAPLVNSAGKVVGVAFGVSNLRRSTAFAVATEELGPVLAQPRTTPVSTGPCLTD